MSKLVIRRNDQTVFIPPAPGALLKYLQKNGRTPPITLSIHPLEDLSKEIYFGSFLSYNFKSSVMTPVESFQCEVFYKKQNGVRKPMEGDVFVLRANNIPISTGIVDMLDMETSKSAGTRLTISGRNLLGQFEDQDSVSLDSNILWGNKYTVLQFITALAQNTRINPSNLIQKTAPKLGYLAATQPGESKIASLMRFCEPLDIYFWTRGDGAIIIGRPGMYQSSLGKFFCNEQSRQSNILSIRSTRASTQIPNIILPIWNGQETVQALNLPQKPLYNRALGPSRLRHFGHRTPKAVVVSTPEGSAPQDLADVNALLVAGQNTNSTQAKAGSATILQAYAKRFLARANIKELTVQMSIVGHYNDAAQPITIDQVYRVQYDNDDVDENMYLFEVEYLMDIKTGPQTRITLCKQSSLVSDVRAL